jgi:nucleoside-diphosphate-sugar epimerase
MSARILLTGATGFVGSHVARALVDAGYDVTAVVRTGSTGRIPEGVARIIEVDDLFGKDATWWADALSGITHVIHMAWTATPGKYLKDPANLACLSGTLALAEGAIARGVSKFVGVGSCIEYAMQAEPLSTETPLDPRSPYAGSKAAAYLALKTAFAEAGIDFAWARLFYLHGEGEHPDRLVASLHRHLAAGKPVDLTEGRQIRDFLDVAEGAWRIAAVAMTDVTGPVNICSGKGISIRQMALDIADRYGRRDCLCFGARPENPFDPPAIVGIPTEIPDLPPAGRNLNANGDDP